MQLFCFTFAGGSASFFDELKALVRPDIELVALEYAGHIARTHEPFYQDFEELTADMYRQVKSGLREGGPYALLGYSMGAIAAAEVTMLIIERKEVLPPVHVFLASHAPCSMSEGYATGRDIEDDVVKRWTIRFGGLPKKLVDNPTFWRIYMPIYRADYGIIVGYDFSRLDRTVDIPATLLFSPEDVPRKDMEKWRDIFTGRCSFKEYDGGHFFLKQHCGEVADVIRESMERYDI